VTRAPKRHPRHKIALAHPCTRAADTMHPRFRSLEDREGLLLATILTVNK